MQNESSKIFFLLCMACCVACMFALPVVAQEDVDIDALLADELEQSELHEIYDPLEPMNRVFFQVNDSLYFYVLKPVKTGYAAVLPGDLRIMIGNFFDNLASPVWLLNNLLQGEFGDATDVAARFLINSTVGILGLGDPAAEEFGFEEKPADFGETLGKWGVGEGVYLCLPIIGPSNIRDTVGFAGDTVTHPMFWIHTESVQTITYSSTKKINALSLAGDTYEKLKKISIDPYVATRKAYSDFRRELIKKEND